MAQTPAQIAALKSMMGDSYVPPVENENKSAESEGNDPSKTGSEDPNKPADVVVPPDQVIAPQAIDDARVIEYLKSKNINIDSLDHLVTKPDPAVEAEKREAQKLSFGISKNLFSKKEYDNFITDSSEPDSLVFKDYLREAREEDPEVSEEDVRAEFTEKYSLLEDPNSRKYKRGIKELALHSEKILKERYGKIYNADEKYSQFEQEQMTQTERQAKILANTPKYKQDVESIITDLKNHKIKISDNEEFQISLPEEYVGVLKQRFFEPAYVEHLVEQGYTKELLVETIYMGAIKENLPAILRSYADQKLLAKQAGTRGIVHVHSGTKLEDQSTLNEKQQKAKSHYENILKPTPIAN